MRRPASILALTVAALASVATKRAPPGLYLQAGPEVFLIDPADPQPVVVQLEGHWSEGARRRAEMTDGRVYLDLGVDNPLPDGVGAVATAAGAEDVLSEDGQISDWMPAICDPVACTARVEIRFDAPPAAEPFEVDLWAGGALYVTEYRDEDDVVGELTLSGPGAL